MSDAVAEIDFYISSSSGDFASDVVDLRESVSTLLDRSEQARWRRARLAAAFAEYADICDCLQHLVDAAETVVAAPIASPQVAAATLAEIKAAQPMTERAAVCLEKAFQVNIQVVHLSGSRRRCIICT